MPDGTVAAGMREQLARFQSALGHGMPRLGWKVGFSTPEAMARFGLAAPAVAWLDGNRQLGPGDTYVPPAGAATSIEAEVAVRLSQGGEIEAVAAAIEFVDLARPRDSIGVILGHSVFHDAVMLGPAQPFGEWHREHWPPRGWPVVSVNGVTAAEGEPRLAPADFARLLGEIAPQLEVEGAALEAGDWIITGALATPVAVQPGDDVAIDFGALGGLQTHIDAPA